MKFRIDINVKFRAFKITFGEVKQGFIADPLISGNVMVEKVAFAPVGDPFWSKSGVSVWFKTV